MRSVIVGQQDFATQFAEGLAGSFRFHSSFSSDQYLWFASFESSLWNYADANVLL
jgi:hypothetical protein